MTAWNPLFCHMIQVKPPKMNLQLRELILGQELVLIISQDLAMSTQEGSVFRTCGKSMNPIQVLNLRLQTTLNEKLRTLSTLQMTLIYQ